MRTQIALTEAGPAGLQLSHQIAADGLDGI